MQPKQISQHTGRIDHNSHLALRRVSPNHSDFLDAVTEALSQQERLDIENEPVELTCGEDLARRSSPPKLESALRIAIGR